MKPHKKTTSFFIFFVLFLLGIANMPVTEAREQEQGLSIHQLELENHRGSSAAARDFSLATPQPLNQNVTPRVKTTVFGFHPYWVGKSYENYRYDLLTTISYFSLELNANGNITKKNGWPDVDLINLAHQNGVKVVVTASNFSSKQISSIVGNSANRQNTITNLLTIIKDANGDGVNIDFENVDSSQKNNLTIFMKELATTFHEQLPGSQVTIDIPAVDWAGSFDIAQLATYTDGLVIMGYDYHYKRSEKAGPVSPLTSGEIWESYNITSTVQNYKQKSNQQSNKIILGLPYYGYDWITSNHRVPSTTLNQGKAKTYSDIQKELGGTTPLWDEHSQTPYYLYGNYRQVWYENAVSLKKKYELVQTEELGGIGIWALGYDNGYTDLWDTLNNSFGDSEEGQIALISASQGSPLVKIFDQGGQQTAGFYAYSPSIRGGYQLQWLDLDGDEQKEFITATGAGLGPHLRIFNSSGQLLAEDFVYDKNFRGGVTLATGDINGDGKHDIIVAPQSNGGPNVRIFTYNTIGGKAELLSWFWAFDQDFRGGVALTTADLDGNGKEEIIATARQGYAPQVKIFEWNDGSMRLLHEFRAFDEELLTGLTIKTGQINNDTLPDIIVAPVDGTSQIKIFSYDKGTNGTALLASIEPYGPNFQGGTSLAIGKFLSAAQDSVVIAPRAGGGPNVRTYHFNSTTNEMELNNWFWALQPNFRGGLHLAALDTDKDGDDELLLVPRQNGGPNTRIYSFDSQNQQFILQKWFWSFAPNFYGGVNFAR